MRLLILLFISVGLQGQVIRTNPFHTPVSGGFDWSEADNYWKFDEASGTITDYAGSANGIVTGATFGATGILNDALSYDGDNDYVTIGSGFTVGSNDVSISCWVYLDDNTATGFWTGGADNGALAFGHSGAGLWIAESGVGTYSAVTSSITLSESTWTHVAMVYDQSANNCTFYINGSSEVESFSYEFTYTNTIIGGRKNGVGSGWFAGDIDEMAIFVGYKLSSSEVSDLYGSGTPPAYE